MADVKVIPPKMALAAAALVAEARIFAAGNIHPDHRDGGEEERMARDLEACQNAMTAVLNASELPSEGGLQAVGALVGTVLCHFGDADAAMEIILGQAGATLVQFGIPDAKGSA